MSLNIHESLTYSAPQMETTGEITFTSFKPYGATTFNPGESISIKMSSTTEFVNLERSYCKFQLVTDSVGVLNPQGASSVFNTVQDTVNGESLDLQRNWYIQRNIELCSDSASRKQITGQCEGFTNNSVGITTAVGYVMDSVMPVVTTLSQMNGKMIPLAFLNGGHVVNYSLNPASVVVSTGTYQVRNFEIVLCMVKPEPSYLQEISKGLTSGGALKIPLTLTKSITTQLTTANIQTISLSVGYYSSINKISFVERNQTTPFVNNEDLRNYYLLLDGQRFPRNKSVYTLNESIYQILAGYNSSISSISVPHPSQYFNQYSWKANSSFGSGISSSNGLVEISCDFSNSGIGAGNTLESLVEYDALLLISQDGAQLLKQF
jgi:hypothetical protein